MSAARAASIGPDPRLSPRSLVVEQIARHRDPRSRLRARGRGLLSRRPPALELYYEPGDPHSHLCAQLLPMLLSRLATTIQVRLVGESAPEDYPERERQRAYAVRDAIRIAPARGLRFPVAASVPSAGARRHAASELAGVTAAAAFAEREPEVAAGLFAGQLDGSKAPCESELLAANARRRRRLGHYLPAVWQFDGDWFWGVDRLEHLEARLRRWGVLSGGEPLSELRPRDAALPAIEGALPPLEFFYSVRSPYSYLALRALRDFHSSWPAGVVVRPVLPMAMRAISVPLAKRMYTLRDVQREADRLGVRFGRVADPLGEGARRSLQVFPLADSTEHQLEYLWSAARAVWSEGLDVADDACLRYVCERAGIAWPAARARIAAGAEIEYADHNRLELLGAGLWGVPCYRVGAFAAWGQDRFWMLPELLRRHRER